MANKTIRIFGKGKKERIVLFGQKAHDQLNSYFNQNGQNRINRRKRYFSIIVMKHSPHARCNAFLKCLEPF